MAEKIMDAQVNQAGGCDLLIERDAGNPVLILMGKPENAVKEWKRLRSICNKAIKYCNYKLGR